MCTNFLQLDVERTDSFRYLCVCITKNLSWSSDVSTLVKKACQRLYHLRHLRDFRLPLKVLKTFPTCTVENVLTGSITAWFGSSTKRDYLALQRVLRSAWRTIRCQLSALQDIYTGRRRMRAERIIKDVHHPSNRLFSLLSSGRCYCCLKAKTERMGFFAQAIRVLNQWLSLNLHNCIWHRYVLVILIQFSETHPWPYCFIVSTDILFHCYG